MFGPSASRKPDTNPVIRMLNTDTSIDLKRVLYLSIAFVGLLLLTRLAVPFMRRNNKSRSLTDLKSLARSYISFQDGDNTSRAKSFTGEKKRECISCVNFRYGFRILIAVCY